MKFYDREDELKLLEAIEQKARGRSYLTLIYGRRRVGKTRLLQQHFKNKKFLYFFVSKKSDSLLARDFMEQIKQNFQVDIFGTPGNSQDILRLLVQLGKKQPINVVFDEFQNYDYVNRDIFAQLQKLWDTEIENENTRLNFIFSGSSVSLIKRIFLGEEEPLFGRLNYRLHLQPLKIRVLKEILIDHNLYTHDNLIDLYIFSGGVPKYIDFFIDSGATTFEEFVNGFIFENSPLLEEGKFSLMEEFGKKYGVYFAILQLIAEGKTKRSEIMSILKDVREIGGYLNVLEDSNLKLILKNKPINQKSSRNIKYVIDDPFYQFWFRFVYKNISAVEAGNFDYLKQVILRDWSIYRGVMFEKFVKEVLKESLLFNRIGSYWDKNGLNEIDVTAVNDDKKYVLAGECKLNQNKAKIDRLMTKFSSLERDFVHYRKFFKLFYPGMIDDIIENPGEFLFDRAPKR
jgi:AAA+ ATPase superfamily predicted ATPase